MFDIAFSELIVIGIVALIAIGPDKLPKVARTAGHLLGRAQRYVNDVKSEMDNELRLEELQKLQAEILQNTNFDESPQYKVGQVIRHNQVILNHQGIDNDQIIPDDGSANEHLVARPIHPTTMMEGDYVPTQLRTQLLNKASQNQLTTSNPS